MSNFILNFLNKKTESKSMEKTPQNEEFDLYIETENKTSKINDSSLDEKDKTNDIDSEIIINTNDETQEEIDSSTKKENHVVEGEIVDNDIVKTNENDTENTKNNKIEFDNIEDNKKYNEKQTKKIEEQQDVINKQLSGYLSNDSNLDNSLIKMNKELSQDIENELSDKEENNTENKITSDKKTKNIEIVKEKKYKNLTFIFIQFVIGVILISISFLYISGNTAEYKFMQSSLQLWTNTINNIMSHFGGVLGDDAKDKYIKKREGFVDKLSKLQEKLKICIKENSNRQDYLYDMDLRVSGLKNKLMDTSVLPLESFIKEFEQYSLGVNSLEASVKIECK